MTLERKKNGTTTPRRQARSATTNSGVSTPNHHHHHHSNNNTSSATCGGGGAVAALQSAGLSSAAASASSLNNNVDRVGDSAVVAKCAGQCVPGRGGVSVSDEPINSRNIPSAINVLTTGSSAGEQFANRYTLKRYTGSPYSIAERGFRS